MTRESTPRRGPVVEAYVRPYDYLHDGNATYYFHGLRRYVESVGGRYEEVSMGRMPELLRLARRVRRAYHARPLYRRAPWVPEAIDRVARRVEGPLRTPSGAFSDMSHQCLITLPGGARARVCIQSDDEGSRLDPWILAWSDVTFKTNYWPALSYPSKVVPAVNGDPLVIPRLSRLRAYRALPKRYDVCMVVRVWGGSDEVEGVEHNLRLVEAVARARCSKYLYAYLVAGDIDAARRRLARAGVPCGVHPLPAEELWRASAASRLNVVRLGMHYCIPWRVTGALAIGSAMVLDRAPLTRWPEPLEEGVHYVALGTGIGLDRPLAADTEYAAIRDKIEAWLADRDLASRIGHENGAYYDRFAAPERVGEYIVRTAASRASSGS
jgi:hypothetical protein